MSDVYYKVDGSNVYVTNQNKSGYTLLNQDDTNIHVGEGKNVLVEAYDNKFVLPKNPSSIFYGSTNSSFNLTSYWDGSEVTNLQSAFMNCEKLTSLNLSSVTFGRVYNTQEMFKNCKKLSSVTFPSTSLDHLSVTSSMFEGCSSLTRLNLTSLAGSNITTLMQSMFRDCTSLVEIKFADDAFALDWSSWMFRNCTSLKSISFNFAKTGTFLGVMNEMFYNCTNLESVDFSHMYDIKDSLSNGIHIPHLFYNCKKLKNVDLGWLDYPEDVRSVFENCVSLETIDFRGITYIGASTFENTFYGCTSLNTVYVQAGQDWRNYVTGSTNSNMFSGCTKLPHWDGTKNISKANTSSTGYFTPVWIPKVATGYIKTSEGWKEADAIYFKVNRTALGWKESEVYV